LPEKRTSRESILRVFDTEDVLPQNGETIKHTVWSKTMNTFHIHRQITQNEHLVAAVLHRAHGRSGMVNRLATWSFRLLAVIAVCLLAGCITLD